MPAYVEPIVWAAGDNASASRMNVMQDNIRALKTPPIGIYTVRGNGSNASTTLNTVPNAVDGGNFSVALAHTGGMLRLNLDAIITHSVASGIFVFDVQVDGSQWISSLTTTPVSNGLWYVRSASVAAGSMSINMQHVVPAGAVAAGNRTFVLHWKVITAGTATMGLAVGVCQFSVSE